MRDIMWHLTRCELFREVATQRREWIESRSLLRKVPPQGLVQIDTTSGDPDTLFLLAEGLVRVCHLHYGIRRSVSAVLFVDLGLENV